MTFYEAWVTRASEQGAPQWDNTALMEEILGLRHEIAQLVGFANFAEYSLATKMARDPAEVLDFLRRLAHVTKAAAQREFAELEAFAGTRLEAWDVAYLFGATQARAARGLGRRIASLLPVAARARRTVCRRDSASTASVSSHATTSRSITPTLGSTTFSTPTVRAAAAFSSTCMRGPGNVAARGWTNAWGASGCTDATALPVAYLVCNFTPPGASRPALLTHYEVLTMFHEFGHGLHHMLTRVDFPSVAGINGVPWDAVELPSQFMENFAWREEVLPLISSHVDTGEPLPVEMLRKLQATRTFQAGMQTVRQLEFSLFDFRIHAEYSPERGGRIREILAEVRDEVAVVRPPAFNRFPHSFQHIFSGGYAAGYYSYKWAEVLSADAFGAFEESGIFDPVTARRFLQSILERGGSRDAMDAFVEFRGRKPELEPLLRQMGLAA